MKVCLKCGTNFKAKSWLCPSCKYQPNIIAGHYVLSPELNSQNSGYRQEDFERLFDLEASNFWFRSRNRLIIWAIEKYFSQPRKMLEIGIGTGFVLSGIEKVFFNTTLIGSDISINALAFAARRINNAQLVQFDATTIPYNNEFDVIGAFDVLEHVEDDEQVLARMNKAIVTGGGIVITVPQHQFLWSQTDESAYHLRRYSGSQLKKKVEASGFEVIRVTSFVSLLFPLMVLSRFLKKGRVHKDVIYSELKLNSFVNNIFYKILTFERLIIKHGFDFPFGGSLLIIARKVF